MQLHHLTAHSGKKKRQRVGRGGKRGTFSGRGTKGQKARAGAKIRPHERELLKTIPKLRGYKFKSFREKPAVINLCIIDRHFKEGESVTPETLAARRLISKRGGRIPTVKILGKGTLSKKLTFKNVIFSNSAKSKLIP